MFIVYDLSRLLDIFKGLLKDIPVTSGGLGTQLGGLLETPRAASVESSIVSSLFSLVSQERYATKFNKKFRYWN